MNQLCWLNGKLHLKPMGCSDWVPYDAYPELATIAPTIHPEVEEVVQLNQVSYSPGWFAYLELIDRADWELVKAPQPTMVQKIASLWHQWTQFRYSKRPLPLNTF